MESKIVDARWEFNRRWSLHDSDDLFVIKISNGEYSAEVTGFTEKEAYKKANWFIESENNKEKYRSK